MITLAFKTDERVARLWLYDGRKLVAADEWEAFRILAETLQLHIDDLVGSNGYTLADIKGIIAYQGPGSFTGLRIGISVANAMAYALPAKIVGRQGDSWLPDGLVALAAGEDDHVILPEYGAPVHITTPRK